MNDLLLALTGDPGVTTLLAGNSSGDGAAGVLFPFLAGPAVFIAVYLGIYRFYRNTDKRHEFERRTEVSVGNLRSADRRVGSNNRQRSRRMNGSNEDDHLVRVQRIQVR